MSTVPPVQPGFAYPPSGARPEPAAIVGNNGGHGAAATALAGAVSNNPLVVPPADPLIAALADALEVAAARQNGLAPLFADLEALVARPDVPAAVRNAAQALLDLRLPESALDGATLQKAISRSGLFLEAVLANGLAPDTNIKSALQALRASLQGWLGVDGASADLHAAPPLPPFRGSLPVAQPPVPASIVDTGLRQAGLKVLSETDAAIARHVMLQIASLPASQQPSHPPDDHTQRLVLDIPLATPQGTTIVQIQIEREAPRREREVPVWSVRFAVDIEPIGAVRARVSQIGDKTSVTLVADKPASADALKENLAALKTGLTQAQLEPGDLHCLSHEAPKVAAPQGQFLNRAS
ncbi:MAG: flagellar hook-length control protein FliK [Pseudolabrys sp.]|jgi:hypothetical protein